MGKKSKTRRKFDPSEKIQPYRFLNRDGSVNAWLPSRRKVDARDLYHSMLALSWPGFLAFVLLVYLVINVVFATAYFICGPMALGAVSQVSPFQRFLDTFFFSVQTFATIGYGKMTPETVVANIIVTLEAITGLLGFAIATGLLFARFSRPTARIVFSDRAVINAHDGIPTLLFRLANERFNQIAAAQVQLVLAIDEVTKEGESYRTLYDLDLERNNTPIFGLSWTVVHPITKESPLHGLTMKDLQDRQAEVLVSVSGVDETFMQTIYARFSYTYDEIVWNKRHADILSRCEGRLTVDMEHFHDVEDLPPLMQN
jgi:inward rectifier potassium channel